MSGITKEFLSKWVKSPVHSRHPEPLFSVTNTSEQVNMAQPHPIDQQLSI